MKHFLFVLIFHCLCKKKGPDWCKWSLEVQWGALWFTTIGCTNMFTIYLNQWKITAKVTSTDQQAHSIYILTSNSWLALLMTEWVIEFFNFYSETRSTFGVVAFVNSKSCANIYVQLSQYGNFCPTCHYIWKIRFLPANFMHGSGHLSSWVKKIKFSYGWQKFTLKKKT